MVRNSKHVIWLLVLTFGLTALIASCNSNSESPNPVGLKINRVIPDSGTVGTSVTVLALGVDPRPSNNHLSFNGVAATVQSLTDSSLTVTVPKGATSGPLRLKVPNYSTTGPAFKVLAQGPVIQSVSPASAKPGDRVTITGKHFLPQRVLAKVHGDSTGSPGTAHQTGIDSIRQENTDSLKAPGPRFTSQKDARPTTTIGGLPVSVSIGGKLAPLLSLSNTKIVIQVPKGATGGKITVTVGSKSTSNSNTSGSSTKFHTIAAPQIASFSPQKGLPGTPVTIKGTHFSSHADSNKVIFNGTAASVSKADSTRLQVAVPRGAQSGPIQVTTHGQTAASRQNFTVAATSNQKLVVAGLSPKSGTVGTSVTISGQNFASSAPGDTVTFNGTKATIQSASTTKLTATVPKGATSGPVKVQAGGQTATGPSFSVTQKTPPQVSVSNISPKSGPVGTTVTISGKNFSSSKSGNKVTFNGTKATIQAASTTKLTVTVPKGATTGPVKVTVGNQTATGPSFTLTANPANQLSVSGLSPKTGPVGTSVSISGQNFASSAANDTVTFNGTKATVQSASSTKLTATVPKGATSGPVKVQTGGQVATGPDFSVTVNQPPTITSSGSFDVKENTTAVTTITATDPDGDSLTYHISGGTDAARFTIGKTSGKLAFKTAPDYENPADADRDNNYTVGVAASDSSLSVSKTLTVAVQNVNEPPVITSGQIKMNTHTDSASLLNGKLVFGAVPDGTDLGNFNFEVAVSPHVDLPTGASVGGADAGSFSVSGLTKRTIHLKGPVLKYTHSAGGTAHQYQFTVTAKNTAGQTTTRTIIIPVQPFAGGSGTAASPYQVTNVQQLQRVSQHLSAYFKQTKDIDASATQNWNGGKGLAPIGNKHHTFTGTYDGNGKIINNLYINRPSANYVGLFGDVYNGTIKNTSLRNISIKGSSTSNIGGLVGRNDGSVKNSSATGSAKISSSTAGAGYGGLVGDNYKTITHSYANVTVSV
ncbi:MAG TPA: IPT/TIG domain-containing protein, partial [Balneolaceae bacterium]|nr:IPT/TIG domain-containing protein [Balneolaceae bacterium]